MVVLQIFRPENHVDIAAVYSAFGLCVPHVSSALCALCTLAFFAVLSQRTQLLLIQNGVDVNFVQGYAMAFVRWPLSLFALIAFIAGTVWALQGMEWYEALLIFLSCCGVGSFLVKKANLVSRAWKKPLYDVMAIIFALLMWFVVGA